MRNRKQKKKKEKPSPPRLGHIRPKPRPRPLSPLSSRGPSSPATPAPTPRLTARPHQSAAPPLSLSRRSSAGSSGPLVRSLVQPMPSPVRSPPTTACPVSLPLTRAPALATSPPLYPSRPLTPRLPEPSCHRLLHHRHHGELVGARRPPVLPPPRPPIKGPPRAPCSTTPGLSHSISLPRAQSDSAPSSLPSPVSSDLLPLLSPSPIHMVLELRHSLTNAMHPSPPPIALDCLTGDLTAASARHRAMDRPP
jgi:hypothetical protein